MGKTFSVSDFKGVREISLSPTGSLVVIAGANGAGKSSFIDAFVELFDPKGVRLTPKPIREGEGVGEAYAEYTDTDLGVRIVRTWKKNDAGKLEVFALDGAKYSKPAEVVAQLTGGLIFDPVAFLNLDEKKQRDALLAKVDLPFDVDELARQKKGVEDRRAEAGREVKRLQGAFASLPVPSDDALHEEVSSASILAEIEEAQNIDRQWHDANAAHEAAVARRDELGRQIEELLRQQGEAEIRVGYTASALNGLPDQINIAPLQERLRGLDEVNAGVRARKAREAVAADLEAAEVLHATAQTELDKIEQRKRDGLATATFPVDGLSVDESGVTFDGIPFSQVNSAARRKVAFGIATAGDPKLKLVIVKDGDLLDSDSLTAIRELADARGYTVLVERDRDESRQIGFTIVDGALADTAVA